jgi:hypothetical protein
MCLAVPGCPATQRMIDLMSETLHRHRCQDRLGNLWFGIYRHRMLGPIFTDDQEPQEHTLLVLLGLNECWETLLETQ